MAIAGVSVRIGAVGEVNGAQSVTKAHIDQLIDQAKASPDFQNAKGKYEFRLRETGGNLVLELKQQNIGSKFTFFGGNRRSAERQNALDAISQHYPGLIGQLPDGRIDRATARTLQDNIVNRASLQNDLSGGALIKELNYSEESTKSDLKTAFDKNLKSNLQADGILHKSGIDLLNRSKVDVGADGRVVIAMGKQSGNVSDIANAFRNRLGDLTDDQFRNVMTNVMMPISTGIHGATVETIGQQLAKKYDVEYLPTPDYHVTTSLILDGSDIVVSNEIRFGIEFYRDQQHLQDKFGQPGDENNALGRQDFIINRSYRVATGDLMVPPDQFDITAKSKGVTVRIDDKKNVG